MNERDEEQFAFNVHAELYENEFGDLAVRFEGEKVYRGMSGENGRFQEEAQQVIRRGELPAGWQEIPAHQLLYGRDWHCISRLGFIDGDLDRPAVEFEVEPEQMGTAARAYLSDLLH